MSRKRGTRYRVIALQRAEGLGFKCGLGAVPGAVDESFNACPYSHPDFIDAWRNGWRDGRRHAQAGEVHEHTGS